MKGTGRAKALLAAGGIVAERMESALAQAGFEVDQASDRSQALAALEQGFYQIVVVDFRLPDAYEVCRQVNTMFGTPLMVIEDHFVDEDWVSLMSLGVDGYLPAQGKDGELVARINGCLRRRGGIWLKAAA